MAGIRAEWHACFNASDLKGTHTLNIIYNDILIVLMSNELHNKAFAQISSTIWFQLGFSDGIFSGSFLILIYQPYCGKRAKHLWFSLRGNLCVNVTQHISENMNALKFVGHLCNFIFNSQANCVLGICSSI